MTLLDYLVGMVLLAVVAAALAFGAVQARRRWLPTWKGAPARLAEITGALAVVIVLPQLLGAVGLFRRWAIVVAIAVVGAGVGFVARRTRPRVVEAPEPVGPVGPDRAGTAANWVAGALVAVMAVQWVAHVAASYAVGIRDGDSLWYHLPFAADFAQSGSTTSTLFTNADALVTYFPANAETVSGVTMALMGRDVLVPLLNLGWLALTLLAAWCIGSRYRAGAVSVAAVAMVMSIPMMAATQAGTARNDMMGIALVLAAVALVVHARWDPVALGLAGAANGLALGVKLSSVPVAVFLLVAVLVVAPRARRWRIALPWVGSFVVFGAFWYVRNLVLVGNPLPWAAVKLGPISLPSVYAKETADSAVLDRLRESGGYARVLRPGLHYGIGPAWPFLLGLLVVTVVLVVVLGRGRIARMLGVVAGLGLLAYVVMPNGSPDADSGFGLAIFGLNLRYAFAAMTLAFVCWAVLPRMDDGRVAFGAVAVLGVLSVVNWAHRGRFETGFEWQVTDAQRTVSLVVVAVVAASAALVAVRWRRDGFARAATVGAAVVALGAVVAGFFVATADLDHRYRTPDAGSTSSPGWAWAQGIGPARIGVFGDVVQYPYVGPQLANRVRFVGVETEDGGARDATSCREWLGAIADGGYDYVVTTVDFVGANAGQVAQMREWTELVPGVRRAMSSDRVTIYELPRAPEPDDCP